MCEIIITFVLITGSVSATVPNVPCDRVVAVKDSARVYPALPSGDVVGATVMAVPAPVEGAPAP